MLHSRLRSLPRKALAAGQTKTQASQPDFSINNDNNDEDDGEEEEAESEDIFSDFLAHLLPDDAPQFHGNAGQLLRYESPLYGPLTIMVPHYPDNVNTAGKGYTIDDGRKLFAHMLWSAALVVAQGVEDAAVAAGDNNTTTANDDAAMWSVKGHKVLELGAGAGLPSIISALSSAAHVTISDHPLSPAFLGAIEYNITRNVPALLRTNIESIPHEWGVLGNDDDFAQKNKGRFTRIIAADCLWMVHQHENLVKTLLWFLSEGTKGTITSSTGQEEDAEEAEEGEGEEGRVWIVAGIHTGRAIVASFFETALAMGLDTESIYERDLNGEGRRPWEPVRAGEGVENRRRWVIIAVLKRSKGAVD